MLGVPANSAGTLDGVARAPGALRDAGLLDALARVADVADHGDVAVPPPSPERDPATHVIDPAGVAAVVEGVRAGVASALERRRFPLVIGGDCPVLLGALAAFGDPDRRGLVFVDGHEDAYPPELSTTGEAADMELGFALGLVDAPWWPGSTPGPPLVAHEHVRVLGPRDVSAIVREGASSLAAHVPFEDAVALAADPSGLVSRAVSSLPERWWLHVDLDVLSTDSLPAVDYPQPGGLTWEQLETVTSTALASGPVGWDLTIYNPDLDPERVHAKRIVDFAEAMFRHSS